MALFVISGVSASGKSTIARLLAGRFERGVCVPGDAMQAMVVSGRLDMRPDSGEGALRQLVLRYAGALAVASVYLRDGFDVVVEDVIIGPVLRDFLALVPVPEFHLVFLDPDATAIERRERERDGTTYGAGRWSVGGLQALLREETEPIGLWLDSTWLSAEQTVEVMLADLDASRVSLPVPTAGLSARSATVSANGSANETKKTGETAERPTAVIDRDTWSARHKWNAGSEEDARRSAHNPATYRVPAACPMDRQTTGNHGHSRPGAVADYLG